MPQTILSNFEDIVIVDAVPEGRGALILIPKFKIDNDVQTVFVSIIPNKPVTWSFDKEITSPPFYLSKNNFAHLLSMLAYRACVLKAGSNMISGVSIIDMKYTKNTSEVIVFSKSQGFLKIIYNSLADGNYTYDLYNRYILKTPMGAEINWQPISEYYADGNVISIACELAQRISRVEWVSVN